MTCISPELTLKLVCKNVNEKNAWIPHLAKEVVSLESVPILPNHKRKKTARIRRFYFDYSWALSGLKCFCYTRVKYFKTNT